MTPGTCSVDNCGKPVACKGYCNAHYLRVRKYGTTDLPQRPIYDMAHFWSQVDKTATCWLWTGRLRSDGYGNCHVRSDTLRYPHRLVAARIAGLNIEGATVDHKCHVRRCVNPEHLQLATPSENSQNLKRAPSTSATGIRGVHKTRRPGVYAVRCRAGGVSYYAGQFTSLAEAEAAAIHLRNQVMTNNLVDRRVP